MTDEESKRGHPRTWRPKTDHFTAEDFAWAEQQAAEFVPIPRDELITWEEFERELFGLADKRDGK